MKTDTWIERVIIQQLSYPDKRYKHDYKGKEASTVELVVQCAHLKDVTEGESTAQTWKEINELEEQIEGDVEQAVERLQDQGLLTKVGEQPLREKSLLTKLMEGVGPETEPADTSPIWTLTDEGLAEAARLNEAYADDLARLAAQYEDPEDAPHSELLPLLKTYGVIPDAL
jgi:hypothetical protein